jgi:hypothetical protein
MHPKVTGLNEVRLHGKTPGELGHSIRAINGFALHSVRRRRKVSVAG